jgi:hypothetical protein
MNRRMFLGAGTAAVLRADVLPRTLRSGCECVERVLQDAGRALPDLELDRALGHGGFDLISVAGIEVETSFRVARRTFGNRRSLSELACTCAWPDMDETIETPRLSVLA